MKAKYATECLLRFIFNRVSVIFIVMVCPPFLGTCSAEGAQELPVLANQLSPACLTFSCALIFFHSLHENVNGRNSIAKILEKLLMGITPKR